MTAIDPASSNAPRKPRSRTSLRRIAADALTIRRVRSGRGFRYVDADGNAIRHRAAVKRLASLAVPPAYTNVCYAADPQAHLQAVGTDAAGRLQYRYHPDWEREREARKARRLARLVGALPRIRGEVAQLLKARRCSREFAFAAVIELVDVAAIRAGGESYARDADSRGATTLLKSDVRISGTTIRLRFTGKGGARIVKEFESTLLASAVRRLRRVPGRRLFQYRNGGGSVLRVRATEVNTFLRDLAGKNISLKDFRTLCACAHVLEQLAETEPASSERQRRRQVRDAVEGAALELANTPAICRKSYVHEIVVNAFEQGQLIRAPKPSKGLSPGEKMLAKIVVA